MGFSTRLLVESPLVKILVIKEISLIVVDLWLLGVSRLSFRLTWLIPAFSTFTLAMVPDIEALLARLVATLTALGRPT